MAHPDHEEYFKKIKKHFKSCFKNCKALDVGALDVNGNNRHLFDDTCEYVGLDVIKGKNVDVVSTAHEYKAKKESFDIVLSSNAMEHDMYYKKTLKKMTELLKPGGLMFFTVAHTWYEHGTKQTTPHNSATSTMGGDWENYYKNLNPEDIESALDLDKIFTRWKIQIKNKDLQFWGIKKGKSILKMDAPSIKKEKLKSVKIEELNTVLRLYNHWCSIHHDIREHLPTLKAYAKKVKHVTEFGVRGGRSTIALLAGKPKDMISYDIDRSRFKEDHYNMISKKYGIKFKFYCVDTLNINIEPTELLFIDTLHTYNQLKQELALHGNKASKYLIFHDTFTYGVNGEDGSTPGLKSAIAEFITANPHWKLKEEFTNNNGLTILERI